MIGSWRFRTPRPILDVDYNKCVRIKATDETANGSLDPDGRIQYLELKLDLNEIEWALGYLRCYLCCGRRKPLDEGARTLRFPKPMFLIACMANETGLLKKRVQARAPLR